ncbi:uncharacterized protein K452DRAFT_290767 [Aplosporella prunicola CBS 121167]|uniref:AA1-like domain-containing protein n=1 Tax=Aplosporella prunicola CBS 121167 TaxID=1176127 RepID=A0A6A6B739_9PEZI|nr:uncharacterized protein K452DRAFT_290767 [Aplosporella prunicola CBS 121167]KAF2138621.1 hypothetical protein K452DRAFT_290767 [Aplosporella prunicola CBS 121167]
MLFSKFLQVVALAAAVNAFTIPEGTEDGVYAVKTDANGIDQHTKLADATPIEELEVTKPNRFNGLVRRDRKITCGGTKNLNHADTDAANADLDRQCGGAAGNFVASGHNFYAIRGNTVAFYCNFGGDNRCDSVTRAQYSSAITSLCGAYNSGWGTSSGKLSYGYDVNSSKFCGSGA